MDTWMSGGGLVRGLVAGVSDHQQKGKVYDFYINRLAQIPY